MDERERDWNNSEITEPEPDDKIVEVWEIEPSMCSDADYTVIRAYEDAVDYAQQAIEYASELHTREELLAGQNVVVEMRLKTMRLGDYRALLRDGPSYREC